jgi:peptidoglycan/LPS O-acetylase OafA/YrhL
MQQAEQSERAFFGSLESLRGVAALSVVLSHALWMNPIHQGYVRNSYLMVDLFFVLSGFLICHAYGERLTSRRQLRDFTVLRLGRLYPVHVTLLAAFVALEVAWYLAQGRGTAAGEGAFAHNNGAALVSNLLLTHSLGLHGRFTFNGPSWSISAEFFTYIMFALALYVIGPRLKHWQLPIFVLISALGLAMLLVAGRTDLNVTHDFGIYRCITGFFLGAAAYLLLARSDLARRAAVRTVAPYVATAALVGGGIYLGFKAEGPSDFLILPLATVLVLALALSPHTAIDRWLQAPALVYLGTISYSLYMVHYLVARVFGYILRVELGFDRVPTEAGYPLVGTDPITGSVALAVYVGTVLVLSHASFVWIENRFRRKSKAWVAARRTGASRSV